jgi:16S rRNA (cytosine1402-N4)-methyltransferase
MLNEAISMLNINADGLYVDCTAGFGGHSSAILEHLNDQGKLICIDQDKTAIDHLKTKFAEKQIVEIYHANFSEIKSILEKRLADGIFADLGVSSPMLDDFERGFSYKASSPLDMRMDMRKKKKASDVLNMYKPKELANIFYSYGEIKHP